MSNEHNDSTDEVANVERVLAQFSPRAAKVDRDRLMFLAGAAAGQESGGRRQEAGMKSAPRRASLAWPAATAVLAATSLALAGILFLQPERPVRIVYLNHPDTAVAEAPTAPTRVEVVGPAARPHAAEPATVQRTATIQPIEPRAMPDSNYLRTREVALRMGLDALGTPRSAGGDPGEAVSYFDWLSGLANVPAQTTTAETAPRPKM